MKFDRARNMVTFMLVMCIVACIASIIANDTSVETASLLGLLSAFFFILAFVVVALFCKCPNCGKHIYLGLFKAEYCPKCNRHLITGEKARGRKR